MSIEKTPEQSTEQKNELDTLLYKYKEIFDITYDYTSLADGKYFNNTLFERYCSVDQTMTYREIYQLVSDELNKDYKTFETMKDTISEDSIQGKILLGQIDYALDLLLLTEYGLPFEIEKMGKTSGLNFEQKNLRIKNIQQIEEKIFGGKVSENSEEMQGSKKLLEALFIKNKHRLEEGEKTQFEHYIQIITNHLKTLQPNPAASSPSVLGNIEPHTQLIASHPELLKKKFSAGEIKSVFELVFRIYNIEKPIVLSDSHTSTYDGEDALYIPVSRKVDLISLLSLIQHETETHYITDQNSQHLLGKQKGFQHLLKEEGVASTAEDFMKGNELRTDEVTVSIPQIALGELLSGTDFKEFMRLYRKLKGKESLAESYYLRRKRNYPLDDTQGEYNGVQHKDTTYDRGKKKVIEMILQGQDPIHFFHNKVSFEDMKKIQEAGLNQGHPLITPLLVGEVLLYALMKPGEVTEQNFKSYIQQKYTFLNPEIIKPARFTRKQLETIVELRNTLNKININIDTGGSIERCTDVLLLIRRNRRDMPFTSALDKAVTQAGGAGMYVRSMGLENPNPTGTIYISKNTNDSDEKDASFQGIIFAEDNNDLSTIIFSGLETAHNHKLSSVSIPPLLGSKYLHDVSRTREMADLMMSGIKMFRKKYPSTTLKTINFVLGAKNTGSPAVALGKFLVEGGGDSKLNVDITNKPIVHNPRGGRR